MPRERANMSIDLIEPVRKARAPRNILSRIDKSSTQTPPVRFLEGDEIVGTQAVSNLTEFHKTSPVWHEIAPTLRQVIAVTGARDAGLDVVAKNAQALRRGARYVVYAHSNRPRLAPSCRK